MHAWILLRGFARESGHWGYFTKYLQKAFPDTRIICLDWPGLGCYHYQTMPINPEEVIGSFEFQLENLNIDISNNAKIKIGIIGISLGGAIALYWASRKPKLWSKIVCINSSLANLSSPWGRLRGGALLKLAYKFFREPISKRENAILNLTTHNPLYNKTEILNKWLQLFQQHPVQKKNLLRQLLLGAFLRVKKDRSLGPLILASQHDRLVDLSSSKKIAQAFAGDLHIHEHAGHDLPLEFPDWCIEHILKYSEQK